MPEGFTGPLNAPRLEPPRFQQGAGMTRLVFGFFVVSLLCANSLAAQQSAPPVAAPSASAAASTEPATPDYSQEPFVIELYSTKVRY
jgi:hypothetical protein